MFFTGYFGIQDSVVAVSIAAMVFSTIRKQPSDSTRWIPVTTLSVMRLIAGGAVVLVSLVTPLRQESVLYYTISAAGMVLTLVGAVFFFGAKAPASQIISETGEEGPKLSPSGFYRFCRHPLYFGIMLVMAGVATDLVSPAGAVLCAAVFVPILIKSVWSIDAYWASRTGPVYAEYSKRVNLLIPSRKRSWKRDYGNVSEPDRRVQ